MPFALRMVARAQRATALHKSGWFTAGNCWECQCLIWLNFWKYVCILDFLSTAISIEMLKYIERHWKTIRTLWTARDAGFNHMWVWVWVKIARQPETCMIFICIALRCISLRHPRWSKLRGFHGHGGSPIASIAGWLMMSGNIPIYKWMMTGTTPMDWKWMMTGATPHLYLVGGLNPSEKY